MNKLVRLGPLVSLLAAFTAQLAGCDSAEDTTCTTTGCPAGQACSNGACVSAPGQAGASGSSSPVGGGASAGNGTNAGNAGSVSNGGAAAGTFSGGGQAGTVGNAGSNAQGGMSGGNNGGSAPGGSGQGGSAQGGSGGMAPDANVVGQCKDDFWSAANNGSVTRYDFKQGTELPACTYVITHKGSGSDGDWDTVEGISTGDGGYFGAMNTTDYANGAACGACVEASYNGRKVVLTIVDECPVGSNPKCTKGHIDLSRKAIRQLEPNGSQEDLHGVNWHYIKCPASGNVKARLHPNQNPNWQPVVIENGLFPLKSVTLNGAEAKRAGNTNGGNAWVADGKKAPYTVRATDVNNATITFTYDGDGGLKDVGSQFMCK